MKKSTIVIIAIIAILAIILLIGAYKSISNAFSARDKAERALSMEVGRAADYENQNHQLVSELEETKKVSSDQLRAASDSIFALRDKESRLIKSVDRLSLIVQKVRLRDTIKAKFADPGNRSFADMDCDSMRGLLEIAIIPPELFTYNSDSISFTGVVEHDGVSLADLYIPNKLYERSIRKKTGFLGLGRKEVVQIHSTNSMFANDSGVVYEVNKRPNLWNRKIKPVLCYLGGGLTVVAIASLSNK